MRQSWAHEAFLIDDSHFNTIVPTEMARGRRRETIHERQTVSLTLPHLDPAQMHNPSSQPFVEP